MRGGKHFFFSIILVLTTSIHSIGQSYFANGDARALPSSSCYQLTDAVNWQLGSVWYADKLDISKDFDLEFELNFGFNDGGADGIVFVLQTVGNQALGLEGGGIGFEGFSPSIGVEFDDWQNTSMGDIATDHIAILKNGSVNHNSSDALASPVSARVDGGNIEDGMNHLVRITWNASTNRLEVWFDCIKRQSMVVDIRNAIFGGANEVFWGFTAATGGANNVQVACLRDDIIVQDTFALCKGDSISLNAKESFDGVYSWTPTDFLDDPTSRTPLCFSTVPYTYYVEYKDRCNTTFRDTVVVHIDEPFTMDEGQDTLLCDGARYAFDLAQSYDSVRWGTGITVPTVAWSSPGNYTLRAWQGVCYDDDTFDIETDISPSLTVNLDSLFCEGDSVLVDVSVAPLSATFLWQDGSDLSQRYIDESLTSYIEATSRCNTIQLDFSVREIILPKPFLGNDTTLCLGDTLFLMGPVGSNLDYLWSDGTETNLLEVIDEGMYWIKVSEADLCEDSASILVGSLNKPELSGLTDVLLCQNESITLSANSDRATVIWQDQVEAESYTLKNESGRIGVKAINQCGIDSTTFEVSLIDCYCRIWMPNAVTLNNDILNGSLSPLWDCPKLLEVEWRLYNRWGEKIYTATSREDRWDGTYKDKIVPQGVYFWEATWLGNQNGQSVRFNESGILHVIR